MKKFLLFLTLFLSAVGIATAKEVSYAITFKGNGDTQDANTAITTTTYTNAITDESKAYIASVADINATYIGKGTNGIKIGKSKNTASGNITFNLTDKGKVAATKIVINVAQYNTSSTSSLSLYLNGNAKAALTVKPNSDKFADYTVTLSSATDLTSIKLASNKYLYVKSITVYYDDGTASKAPHGLSYEPTSVILEPYQVLASQPTLKNPNNLTVAYSSSNTDVATVTEEGVIALAGGLGEAVISAKFAGDETYEAGSATFTITVAKRFVYNDTRAVLVTDVNTLQAGDVIIIANQAASAAMSTSTEKDDKRPQTSITLSTDKSEIKSISSEVLLLELGQVEVTENETTSTYWTMKALNYTKDGLLYCGSTNNEIKIGTPISSNIARAYATISIASNKATILFNKGTSSSSSNRNNLRYNNYTNSGLLFACYENGQQPVYIYRLEGSTTITGEEPTCKTPVENGNTTLTANSTFYTNSTASEFVVKMNGVEINATVEKADDLVSVDMVGLPYVPGAVFTISPVVDGKELHPVTLGITIPTLPVVDLGAVTLKLYFDKDAYGSTSTSSCNLDAWAYLPVVLKDAVSKEVLAPEDARRNLALTFKEFANSVAGTEIWGWYDENKDQVQWCKYNYLTVPVEAGTTKIGETELATLSANPVNLTFTPVYSFNVANKFASLIPSATPGSLSAPARAPEGFTVQNVELTALPVLQAWGNTPDVSGVESVVVEGVDGAVEYYNMQGVRVEGELAPGMYIRRQGRSVSKVQIR